MASRKYTIDDMQAAFDAGDTERAEEIAAWLAENPTRQEKARANAMHARQDGDDGVQSVGPPVDDTPTSAEQMAEHLTSEIQGKGPLADFAESLADEDGVVTVEALSAGLDDPAEAVTETGRTHAEVVGDEV